MRSTHWEYSPLLMGEVDVAAVAESLNRLYSDPADFAKVAHAGLTRIGLPEFQWSVPADHLVNALCGALQSRI